MFNADSYANARATRLLYNFARLLEREITILSCLFMIGIFLGLRSACRGHHELFAFFAHLVGRRVVSHVLLPLILTVVSAPSNTAS